MGVDELNRGLKDVIVAETRLSRVDGEAGKRSSAGFSLEEFAPNAAFEETVYHLRHDRLPDAEELESFRAALASRRSIPNGSETGREWTPIDRR